MYYLISEYKFIKFQRSNRLHKKYDAIIEDKTTKKIIRIPFGDVRYENYKDKTGLNLYPKLIHRDKERRKLFRDRFNHIIKPNYFSPGYFSYYYLW